MRSAGVGSRISDGLRRRWRSVQTQWRRPRPYVLREFEAGKAGVATAAGRELRRSQAVVIRGAIDRAQDVTIFADNRLVRTSEPGNNLLTYISQKTDEGFATDFWLLRAALTPRVIDIAAAYFGTRDMLLPLNNQLIRQFRSADDSRKDLLVPFHQDGAAFPAGVPMLNCWTPLYPQEVGTTAPGLDLSPVAVNHILSIEEKPTSKHYRQLETRHSYVERYAGTAITPSLRLGDMLMFTGNCLHRTSVAKGMSSPRVSAEVRLITANRAAQRFIKTSGADFATISNDRLAWPSVWRREGGNLKGIRWTEARIG